MPKLINKKTKQEYSISETQLKELQKKPHIIKAFEVKTAETPVEVLKLRNRKNH